MFIFHALISEILAAVIRELFSEFEDIRIVILGPVGWIYCDSFAT